MEGISNKKKEEEKKTINIGNLLDNDVLIKKTTAFVVILTLVLGIFFAGKENVYLVQIARSNAINTIDSITATKKDFINSASDHLLSSISNIKHSITTDAEYINTSLKTAKLSASNNISLGASASASVLTSITQTTKDIVDGATQLVNDAISSTLELFNKPPEEQPTLVVEEETKQEQTTETKLLTQEEVTPTTQPLRQTQDKQQVIERVVETQSIVTVSGLTQEDMNLALEQLENKVYSDMYQITGANESKIINNYQVIGQTSKIDKLGNVTISNSTISGTLSGLTDAHIPDGITASNYLPLSGGTLTGNLIAEYFTATTATSTFAGQLGSTFIQTIEHSFGAWAVDVAGAEPTNESFYMILQFLTNLSQIKAKLWPL